jgi:ubiquinol-cytochrome c reductase iron-sulfur subunit
MSIEKQVDPGRRGLLVATCAAGGVAGLATAGAFVSTFQPSERAKAAGAPVEADISDLKPGNMKIFEWRGKPVWVLKRTPEMMESLAKTESEVADPKSEKTYQMPLPEYCKNQHRSREEHKDILVVVGICSHLGCSPGQNSRQAHNLPCPMIGKAGSCAHAMARPLTWPPAFSRTSRHRTILTFRRICICPIPRS